MVGLLDFLHMNISELESCRSPKKTRVHSRLGDLIIQFFFFVRVISKTYVGCEKCVEMQADIDEKYRVCSAPILPAQHQYRHRTLR